jgi:hypothetical protein
MTTFAPASSMRAQAVGREAAEDHRVDGAEARDGEHRGDRLGDHRQVDRDAVALPTPRPASTFATRLTSSVSSA